MQIVNAILVLSFLIRDYVVAALYSALRESVASFVASLKASKFRKVIKKCRIYKLFHVCSKKYFSKGIRYTF